MTPSSPATQQRCMWFPKSDSLGLTDQVVVGGSYRGPGAGVRKWRLRRWKETKRQRLRSEMATGQAAWRLSASSRCAWLALW